MTFLFQINLFKYPVSVLLLSILNVTGQSGYSKNMLLILGIAAYLVPTESSHELLGSIFATEIMQHRHTENTLLQINFGKSYSQVQHKN